MQLGLDSEIGRSLEIQDRSSFETPIVPDPKIQETCDLILGYEYRSLLVHNSDLHKG